MNIERTSDVQIDEEVNFEVLISNPNIIKGLSKAGYERPSPIQLKAIPPGKLGIDVIAQAKSGTGKTIVFGIIALGMLDLNNLKPQVLVLAPTREIAVQIKEVICNIGRYMEGLYCHVFIGGLPIGKDLPKLEKCQIVIGTPGRIDILLRKKNMSSKNLKLLVLDEADKLMESNFFSQIKKINVKLPVNKQVLAFSATYDKPLLKALSHFVRNPHHIMLSDDTLCLQGVLQYYQLVESPETNNILDKFKIYEAKFQKLAELLGRVPFYQCIVFMNHRGLDQQERLETMSKARRFQIRVLVCSDLIARGIDIERVNLVVNLDMPKDAETYLHRVGRTGRYGTYGLAISFVDINEMNFIESLKENYHVGIHPLSDEISFKHHQRTLTTETDQKAYEKFLDERDIIKVQIPEIPPVLFSTDDKQKESHYYQWYNNWYNYQISNNDFIPPDLLFK
ncbi:1058_t:CDS:10 [Funneliformis geosporum]|uniref:RNA helicase n=1 Tax=Funneliformis geosporum TaxID=1117311 RepID=A0A9W4SKE4_9GLOM|nr:1058_t:CDS:10 [Funneliformis geosporum]CAI2172720.1 11390_t:CDS:10 [Funneliformis geosporum]